MAILVDGGYFRKRARNLWGEATPEQRVRELEKLCLAHVNYERSSLYRVFYYDCPPLDQIVYHPLLKMDIDLKEQEIYKWSEVFYGKLKLIRKMALRFGRLHLSGNEYVIKPKYTKQIFDGVISVSDLKEQHFMLPVSQKGVDMRIGLDIASMAHKGQITQAVLIAGDSDFVPIAKHARREGIEFILDPMKQRVKPELYVHLDDFRNMSSSVTSTLTYTKDEG